MLHFLSNKPALGELFNRRPDIGDIELTCTNTSTTLPYVDLVNEVLENAVTGSSVVHQSHWKSEELRSAPEYLNSAAYDKLMNAVYPFDLPFNLWHSQAAEYLKQIGLSHYLIMRTFSSASSPVKDVEIAAAHLGLNALDHGIITGITNSTVWNFWGVDAQKSFLTGDVKLSILLQKSGLDCRSLSELIGTGFVNLGGNVKVTFSDMDCDTDKATIGHIDEDFLDRFHRFVRLQRKLGWEARDLDKAITAFSAKKTLDDELLINISQMEELRADLARPIEECLSWWSRIDTAGDEDHPSLYDRLFLEKSTENLSFILNNKRDELKDLSHTVTEHVAEILSALKISADDLSLLVGSEVDNKLNLANIGQLYRIVSISRALKLKIGEFLSMKALSNIDPFRSPRNTLNFAEILLKVRNSNFSIADLDYIFRDVSAPGGPAPSDESIAKFILSLQEDLRKVEGNEIDLVVNEISEEFGFDTITTEYLLDKTWIPKNLGNALKNANFMPYFGTYYRTLFKAKMIIEGLDIGLSELKWFFGDNRQIIEQTTPLLPYSSINAMAITPDGLHAISGDRDGRLIVWDLGIHKQIGETIICGSPVSAVAITPDGKNAISGDRDGRIIVWNLDTHKQIGETMTCECHVMALAVTPDGLHAISGCIDRRIIVWDLHTHKQIGDPMICSGEVKALAVTPDGGHAISGDRDGRIIVWNLDTHKQIGEPVIHASAP
jgi:WD40 repeat protein